MSAGARRTHHLNSFCLSERDSVGAVELEETASRLNRALISETKLTFVFRRVSSCDAVLGNDWLALAGILQGHKSKAALEEQQD